MKETEMSMKKKKKTTTTKTTTIPVELIMEILSYLPAKSLLNRFKRVCKSWSIVVEEPDFIKKHLNRGAINGGGGGGGRGGGTSSSSSSSNNYQRSLMCRSGKGLFQLHLPFNFEDVPPNSHTVTITPRKLFDSMTLFNSRLVASCNGLLCIDSGGEFLILLNPCTREHKLSPKEPLQNGNKFSPISYGFGCFYDSITTTATTTTTTTAIAEYKVVRIEHSFPSKSDEITTTTSSKSSHVKVYSLSTNSWRWVKDIPNDILDMITKTTNNQSGVFLNGALHWMSHETSDFVSFDMRSEEFRIMPRPPYDGNNDIKVLMVMRGCLGMTRIRGIRDLEISIMKEYGVSESWTHEFVIRLSTRHVGLCGLCSILWLDDQILLEGIGHKRPVVYDMNKKMSVCIDIQDPKCGTDLHVRLEDKVLCIESLVSLKSSSQLTLSKDKKRRVETLGTEIN